MQSTKRRGRPPKDQSEARACVLYTNVTFLMKSKVVDLARKRGISLSDFMHEALTKYLEEVENIFSLQEKKV